MSIVLSTKANNTSDIINEYISSSTFNAQSLLKLNDPCSKLKRPGKLHLDSLNKQVVGAKYAVRGQLEVRSDELREILKVNPSSLSFDRIVNCNIGNPQQMGQKPISFYREVLSLLENPSMIDNPDILNIYKKDVIQRAKKLLKTLGNVGAYSHCQGSFCVRESVAKFIGRRDGFKADPNDIFLTNGATPAASYLIPTISCGPNTGFLIPIPQYPLYTATLTLTNTKAVPYYLNESKGWSVDIKCLENTVKENILKGIDIKGIIVINPGNPTGSCLSVNDITEIIRISAENSLVIVADEVYQENVFKEGQFHSFKSILRKLQSNYKNDDGSIYDDVQLASLHSISKGMNGECGQRGGYMELVGFEKEVKEMFFKLASISICPVVIGQALVDLMVDPPQPGDESYTKFKNEYDTIYNTMYKQSQKLYNAFKRMKNLEVQKPQGAMYLYPKLLLPPKAIDKAREKGEEPDVFYCMELLNNTGICVVPGSGFGQVEGTYHFRTTFLDPTDYIGRWVTFHNTFMDEYK